MKISKYTKLGLLVIACLTILVWGINYLKGIDIFSRNATYYVIYDRIDGLLESSPVNINGYQVGQVRDIKFLEDYSGKLMATLSLRGDFKISKGSTAKIVASDIMGTRSITIDIVESKEYYQPKDTIPGDIEGDLKEQVSMQVLPLKRKAEELLASLDSALTVITYVFNKRTRDNLTESFENINLTIANIEKVSLELNRIMGSGKINSIVNNLDSISGTITSNSGNVTNVIRNLSALTDSISRLEISPMFDDLKSSVAGINSILQKLNADDNTAGMLMNDTQLYQNLNNLAGSMDLLLKDVKNNPKRYVHFSALDVSKDVYITARSTPGEDKKAITYKIQLFSSTSRLSNDADIFKGLGEIEVQEDDGIFTYLAGNTSDFNQITKLLDTARINFPSSMVVAYKKGKRTKLLKAIRNQ